MITGDENEKLFALRLASKGIDPHSVPCQHCGYPSGIHAGTLQANGASSITCPQCAQALSPIDP